MSAKLVFCEGKDDAAVISALALSTGLKNIAVEEFRGRDKLREFLRAVLVRPDFATRQVETVA